MSYDFIDWNQRLLEKITKDNSYHNLPVSFHITENDGSLVFKSNKNEKTKLRIDSNSLKPYFDAYFKSNMNVETTLNLAKNYCLKTLEMWSKNI